MTVYSDRLLGRLALGARQRRPWLRITLSPRWARWLQAAGAQPAESSTSSFRSTQGRTQLHAALANMDARPNPRMAAEVRRLQRRVRDLEDELIRVKRVNDELEADQGLRSLVGSGRRQAIDRLTELFALEGSEQQDLSILFAEAVDAAGDHDRADQLAQTISDPYAQATALALLARAATAAGEHVRAVNLVEGATRAARSITVPDLQLTTLREV